MAMVVFVSGLTGCGSAAPECEELYSSVIGAVDGVASVDAECSTSFGGGWQRVAVHLATNSAEEAPGIGAAILKAIAEEAGMDPAWSTPNLYYLQDGTEATIGLRDPGFNGVPNVGQVRKHYDIE